MAFEELSLDLGFPLFPVRGLFPSLGRGATRCGMLMNDEQKGLTGVAFVVCAAL